jgi:hypothetical protein
MDIAGYLEQKPCQEIAIAGSIAGTRPHSRVGPRQTPMAHGIAKIRKIKPKERLTAAEIKRSGQAGSPGYQINVEKAKKGLNMRQYLFAH